MTYYDLARQLHVAAGTVALVAFWTTAVLRKGTATHKLIGRFYLLAILTVILSAVPLTLHAFLTGNNGLGIFLGYLVLITATAAWSAWRAIRRRTSLESYIGGPYRGVAWLNLLAGLAVLWVGTQSSSPLLMGLSAIGIVAGSQMLRFAARPSQSRQWWLKRHYIGIVGSGVATHVAFLNLGLSHLIPVSYLGPVTYVSWFGPLLAGVSTIWLLNRRYFRAPSAPAEAAS